METVSRPAASRCPKCARCRNHGFVVALKGHVGQCPFSECTCWKCALISERTRIIAKQKGIRKGPERERGVGQTGNVIGASPEVIGGDPGPAASERVNKTPARGRDMEEKTYNEPQVPGPTRAASGACAHPDMSHQLSDHYRASHENPVITDQPHFPWQYLSQNMAYTDVAMVMPFLNAPYTNAYTHPAVFFALGAPPLGAVRFPPIPQAALTEPRQESPGLFYTPYFCYQKPDHNQQYAKDRAARADGPTQQHGSDPAHDDLKAASSEHPDTQTMCSHE